MEEKYGKSKKIDREALVDFGTFCATGVSNGQVTGFLAAQNTAFSDALTDATAVLAAGNLNSTETLVSVSGAVHSAQDCSGRCFSDRAEYQGCDEVG